MYTFDMTWDDWAAMLSRRNRETRAMLDQMLDDYWQWYDRTYNLTDAQVAALIGHTEADVVKMKTNFNTFKKLYDLAHGLDTQGTVYDFTGTMRPF